MNRTQRLVVLVFCCLVAVALFLGAGPFSYWGITDNDWNPLANGVRGVYRNPILGWALPIALVGAGLFVFLGRPKGGAGS